MDSQGDEETKENPVFYTTIEVTQVDEDLAANALTHAIQALAITLPSVDVSSVEIQPAFRSRGAAATFIIDRPATISSQFIQATTNALKSLVLVRLHWVKPTVIIDMVPAPLEKGNN